jgi:hypothetical protein
MTRGQLTRNPGFRIICLLLFAATANSQTNLVANQNETQQKPTIQVTGPTEREALVAGRSTLYCAGHIRYQNLPQTPEIVGGEQEQEQRTFVEGDVVYLNWGIQQEIKPGDRFEIIRPHGDIKGVHKEKKGFLGVFIQEVGQLEVFKVWEHTAVAQITLSCGTVLFGDLLTPIPIRDSPKQRAEIPLDRFAVPSGKQVGRLMMSRDGREMVTKNDVVYIDLGAEDKLVPGEYLTIYRPLGTGNITRVVDEEVARGRSSGFQSDVFRGGGISIQAQRAKDSTAFVEDNGHYHCRPITTYEIKRHRPLMPAKIVGEMVIIDVQTRTATAVITKVASEVHTGDWVEIQ